MPRYFDRDITPDQLQTLIDAEMVKANADSVSEILHLFDKDRKVEFDTENFDEEVLDYASAFNPVMGYHRLSTGLSFLGCRAGGDWEWPLYFIIYYDCKKLRMYIPTKGNAWNYTGKTAFGNDEDADDAFLAKHFKRKNISHLDKDNLIDSMYNVTEYLDDIEHRLLPI